jgi:Ca2+-binding RTX toxin-like protein
LIGSRRDDVFRPAGGADTVQGRRGDDTIYASADGDIDTFSCGPGTDTVVGTLDVFDDLSGCEAVPA